MTLTPSLLTLQQGAYYSQAGAVTPERFPDYDRSESCTSLTEKITEIIALIMFFCLIINKTNLTNEDTNLK